MRPHAPPPTPPRSPINNTRERYRFQFDGVLAPDAKQDEVFERTARPLVASALDGCGACTRRGARARRGASEGPWGGRRGRTGRAAAVVQA